MGEGSIWTSERSRNGGIDRVPVPDVVGQLWLCGKHLIGPDHRAAMARVDASRVVCLNETHELEDRYPDYVAWLRTSPPELVWAPTPDLTAPRHDIAIEVVEVIASDLEAGANVLVHCGAGIGRAGTIAAAVLVHRGMDPDAAVAVVADSRPTAGPEAGSQRELLDRLRAHWCPGA